MCFANSISYTEFYVTSLIIKQTNTLKQYKLEPNNGIFKKNYFLEK